MGKKSTKENKTKYHLAREELGWSREYASEQLGMITPERLERIESEKVTPDPKEILAMAETYGRPSLCNYYCSQKCPIGQQYVPEIEVKELSSIVLEMLASLNSVNKRKDRLIEITADGKIDNDEIDDFIFIQEELERISITVETLQLWSEKMLANGVIDAEAYKAKKLKWIRVAAHGMSHALPYFADLAKIPCPILQNLSFILRCNSIRIKATSKGGA